MHLVFLGNCQVQVLAAILRHFVSPYEVVTTDFVDAFAGRGGDIAERMRTADAIVAQHALQPQPLGHEIIPPGIPVHYVPAVSGAFLYPYQGVAHPAQPVERTGISPYPAEYSDRYLGRLYLAKTPATDALSRYRELDVAEAAGVGRLCELTLQNQRNLDEKAGYACADIIETYLGEEQLFQSAYHFGGRIARHIASILCDRLGFHARYGQRIRDHLRQAPFARLFVPVHPSVARYFGMRWVTDETTYPYRFEGSFTFDEYVLRFMEVRWSEAIQDGVVAFQRREPDCRARLEIGLSEAPRSAEGAHALSVLAEKAGDSQAALALQKRAACSALDSHIHHRLGQLLLHADDPAGAEHAFEAALRLDPVSPASWSALRKTRLRLDRLEDALAAARRDAVFSTDTTQAKRQIERILDRIAGQGTPQAAPGTALPETDRAGIAAELLAHVAGLGDRPSDPEGWAGLRGSKRAIEGFAILPNAVHDAAGLSYEALLGDGSLSPSVEAGGYCGTRGRNRPIHGLKLRADQHAAGRVVCEASFVDGSQSGPVAAGNLCEASSGAALEAFRITLS